MGTARIGGGKNLGLGQPYSPVCKCEGGKTSEQNLCYYPTPRSFITLDKHIFLEKFGVPFNIYRLKQYM